MEERASPGGPLLRRSRETDTHVNSVQFLDRVLSGVQKLDHPAASELWDACLHNSITYF
jgi:hypothetical protein